MEFLYSAGTDLTVYLQHRDYGGIFGVVNDVSDPKGHSRHLLPLLAAVDAPTAAHLLLVSSVCKWLNVLLKWILAEHRPYWWVRESSSQHAAALVLTPQTCETGPGSPSGHLMLAAAHFTLLVLWVSRLTQGRKGTAVRILKWFMWSAGACGLLLASAARVFVAAHFPHQCLLGIVCGVLITLPLSKYMRSDEVRGGRVGLHVLSVLGAALLSLAVYWAIKWSGDDPQWSVKLAFKWCSHVEYVLVSSTPVYSLTQALGALLGWALCVTPSLFRNDQERHSTSTVVGLCLAYVLQALTDYLQSAVPSHGGALQYYALHLLLAVGRTALMLRVVPALVFAHARVREKLIRRKLLKKRN